MLEVENISVSFAGFSLEDISFRLEKGEYMVLLGVSGAGKTVLLEVLAGLVKPASGKVLLNGRDITRQRIQGRGIGLVYQDLSLFPHMTVAGNIAYPLKNRIQGRIDEEVAGLAGQTGIPHLLERYPGTLSGGEAQRVALARTLASNPEVLLLDEPLANLDVKLKAELRSLLRRIHRSGKTIIHVTHDFMEAATLATRVAVIERGRLIQSGRPEEVFRHPATEFVARFSGVKNLFPCKLSDSYGSPAPQPVLPAGDMTGQTGFPVGDITAQTGFPAGSGLTKAMCANGVELFFVGEAREKNGFILVPQDDILLSEVRLASSAVNQLQGVVKEVYLSGQGVEVVVDAGLEMVVSVSRSSREKLNLEPGRNVWLSFKASAIRFIPE
jgi:molybdopterin-binding protein